MYRKQRIGYQHVNSVSDTIIGMILGSTKPLVVMEV